MSYLDLTITEIHQALLEGKVTPLELVKESLKRAKEDNNNAFEYVCEKEALEAVKNLDKSKKNNLLWGIPFALKDNFSTKDIPTTASSNILKDYIPVFSSEVYQRLVDEGAILIGKTTMDELGMGGSGTSGHKGITYNPWDPTHQRGIGGSSSGSAAVTSAAIVPLAIGSDTGDSARKPASYGGLIGFKPTWGRISRYGLFPFAPSLDTVGYFTRSVEDAALILDAIAGRDDKDATSSFRQKEDYFKNLNSNIKGMKIAIIDELADSITNKSIIEAYNKGLKTLESLGAQINHVSMDITLCKAIYPTYIAISCAEAISNNANLDGIRYGAHYEGNTYEEIVRKARTEGFSSQTKHRFIIGGYALRKENREEVFDKAQKCRHIIVDTINEMLKENDVIFLPTAPSVAPLLKKRSKDDFTITDIIADNYLCIANLGGFPSLTIPIGFDEGLPFGGNFIGRLFDEQTVLNISLALEESFGYYNLLPKGKK